MLEPGCNTDSKSYASEGLEVFNGESKLERFSRILQEAQENAQETERLKGKKCKPHMGHSCMTVYQCKQVWITLAKKGLLPMDKFLRLKNTQEDTAALTAGPECYDHTTWTIIFLSLYLFPPPSFLLYYRCFLLTPCNGLELDLPSDKTGTRCLADCGPTPLSITCLILTPTVPFTRASVPANAHPSCTLCACISSLLPYVSLHHWCTLTAPPTCVLPHPL